VEQALATSDPCRIDWITFVGSGEPLLHSELGAMIRAVKQMTGIPVALVTNGSFLCRASVREEISEADAVLPTLDAGSPGLFREINRPHPDFSLEMQVEGLAAFSRSYPGRLWVETVLVRGLNDTRRALEDLEAMMRYIGPDEIHLSLPERPPAEPWVRPAGGDALMRAVDLLGPTARILQPAPGTFQPAPGADLSDAIAAALARHPMREDELIRILEHRWGAERITGSLADLARKGQARVVTRHGRRFWTASRGRYAGTV
jgi:wyosine [tRNA(Phe)-imidazoG37] synthetase (radical SAM superfamily)